MEYTKFLENFKKLNNKEDFVKKHVTTSYIPYVKKLATAMNIAKSCTTVEVGGKEIYKKNTPTQYFLTFMRMIALYTDIEFGDADVVTVYDELNRNDIVPMIFNYIPESEQTEFKALVDMCVNDIYENERDISSLLENKLEAVNMVISMISEAFSDVLKQVDVKELMKNFPQKEASDDQISNVIKFNENKSE